MNFAFKDYLVTFAFKGKLNENVRWLRCDWLI